jgi:hypothetical protein
MFYYSVIAWTHDPFGSAILLFLFHIGLTKIFCSAYRTSLSTGGFLDSLNPSNML